MWATRMLCIQVMLFPLLASCTSSNVPTTVKTVQQGATVTQPVLNISLLDKNDQLMTYHQGELCAEYFCDNGTCKNEPYLESHFQVFSGNLCLIIPNVSISNSGQYSVVLNGYKDVLNLTLLVEEVPQHSILSWLVPVIIAVAVIAVAVLLILVIRLIYKKFCSGFQRTETASPKELPYI